MQPLTVSTQQQTYITNPKTASLWVRQLVKLFPTTNNETTEEMIASMVLIFTQYPESLLSQICNPSTGMPSSFEFLPGLFRFKGYCEQRASEAAEHERLAKQGRAKPARRSDDSFVGCYTGPIENVKPGDILHCTRFDEYREFMKTKNNISTKLWGFHEAWRDNGARP